MRQGLGPLSGQPARPTGPTENWGATSRALSAPTLTHKPTTAYSSSEDEAAAKEEETSEPPGRSRKQLWSLPGQATTQKVGVGLQLLSSRQSNYLTRGRVRVRKPGHGVLARWWFGRETRAVEQQSWEHWPEQRRLVRAAEATAELDKAGILEFGLQWEKPLEVLDISAGDTALLTT